jgi:hypothetical protein
LLDTLEGQICRALRYAVSSVRNLPRTALHRPTSDLSFGLPSVSTSIPLPSAYAQGSYLSS